MPPPDPSTGAPKHAREFPLREATAKRARELWEKNGRPADRDVEFWLEAERQVLGVDASVREVPGGAVSERQYGEATDANHAREERKADPGRPGG